MPATATEKETPLQVAVPESQPQLVGTVEVIESEKIISIEPSRKAPESLVLFKEESNRVTDLSDFDKDALVALRALVRDALNKHEFTYAPPPVAAKVEAAATPPPAQEVPAGITETTSYHSPAEAETLVTGSETVKELALIYETKAEEKPPETEATDSAMESGVEKGIEITTSPDEVLLWGVPLLKDERSDVILLKFLRARDFEVKDAFIMLKNTILWRREFNIDALMDEELDHDLDKVVFMHGFDKEGHPVCYDVHGEFQNKELYWKTFGDEEKRMWFLWWRIQFLERNARKFDFSPGGISTVFQVSDLKNAPGPGKGELRIYNRQSVQILKDNYPEFLAKRFINVPWCYRAFYTMLSPFMTKRTKSTLVFPRPSRTTETLFKYISPEQVPIQYGGLSVDFCDCNPEFLIDDPATTITVKPATKQSVEIQVYEKCIIVWELRVVDWGVSYSAEFVPNAEGAYVTVMQRPKKMSPTDEAVVCNSFKVSELGVHQCSVVVSGTKSNVEVNTFCAPHLDTISCVTPWHTKVFINVPWRRRAFYTMLSPFMTKRTKSTLVFPRPSRTTETLFKYISSEQVPIQYGGLSVDFCDCNPEFLIDDPATTITVKPATKQSVGIQVYEKCIIVWELRVVDWGVSYSAEFVPNAEGAYVTVMQRPKKMSPTDEAVVCNSFKVSELGKIVLVIDNPTSKRKKLVYRFKVKPFSD